MKYSYINPAIDSMTVITPVEIFSNLDDKFPDIYEVVLDDRPTILDSSKKPIYFEDKGVKARLMLVSMFGKMHLSVTWSSKMLTYFGGHYFDGINLNTFEMYAKQWFDLFNIEVNLREYIEESKVFDCDLKVDFELLEASYQDDLCRYALIPGAKTYNSKKKNILDSQLMSGITFVNRNDASIRKPFVKIYSKLEELENRSNDFRYYYVPRFDNSRLRRLECTIKNRRHFESLAKKGFLPVKFMDGSRLLDVLLISQRKIALICEFMLKQNFGLIDIEKIASKTQNKITPTDFLLGAMTYELMTDNRSFKSVLGLFDDFNTSSKLHATYKSRLKTRMTKALKFYISRFQLENVRVTPKDAFVVSSEVKE